MPVEQEDEVRLLVGVALDRPGRIGGRDGERESARSAVDLARPEELAVVQPPQNPFDFSHCRLYSASSRQPLSMVNEWPRLGNSLNSVIAGDLL